MKKEEAKEFLEKFLEDKPNFREEHPGQDEEVYRQMDRLAEALDMAIEALGKDTNVPSNDLISRKDFDKCLEDAEEEAVRNRKYVFASALNTIRGNLKTFPSAQPEIIRCKDCGYYDPSDNDEESDWCHVWCETTEENAFCSYAKRKGEKDERSNQPTGGD